MSNTMVEVRRAGWRVGAALVGLAVPFALAMPVGAEPVSADATGQVAGACVIDLGISASDCSGAVESALVDVTVADVNSSLADQGVPYVVSSDLETPPLDFTADSGNPPVPAVPVIPVPPVP